MSPGPKPARKPSNDHATDRKRIQMRFAHLKRILRLGRLRLRGPCGAQDEFTLAAIAQNLRRIGKADHPSATARPSACSVSVDRGTKGSITGSGSALDGAHIKADAKSAPTFATVSAQIGPAETFGGLAAFRGKAVISERYQYIAIYDYTP